MHAYPSQNSPSVFEHVEHLPLKQVSEAQSESKLQGMLSQSIPTSVSEQD